jgi:hypothetical protein
VFSVDRKQKLLGAFNCSLSDNMLSPGRLYIFEECLGFYSSLPPTSMKARAQRTDAAAAAAAAADMPLARRRILSVACPRLTRPCCRGR